MAISEIIVCHMDPNISGVIILNSAINHTKLKIKHFNKSICRKFFLSRKKEKKRKEMKRTK